MRAYDTNPLKNLKSAFLKFWSIKKINKINNLNFLSFESLFSFRHLEFLFPLSLSYRVCLSPVLIKGGR